MPVPDVCAARAFSCVYTRVPSSALAHPLTPRSPQADEELDGAATQVPQKKNKQVDPKHGVDVSEPPHPISQLVRSGILMPPRSSVVDGANRKMLSESGGAVSCLG